VFNFSLFFFSQSQIALFSTKKKRISLLRVYVNHTQAKPFFFWFYTKPNEM